MANFNEISDYLGQIISHEDEHKLLNQISQTLSGAPRDKKLLMFQGSSGTGKTTFIKLLQKVFGNDCVLTSYETLNSEYLGCLWSLSMVV